MEGFGPISFNFIDLLIVGGIGYGFFSGYKEGLKDPASKVAIVVSLLMGIRFYPLIDSTLVGIFPSIPLKLAPLIAGLIIAGIAFFIFYSLISGMDTALKHAKNPLGKFLNSVDKTIGMLWGGLKVTLLISFVALILGRLSMPPAGMVQDAVVYPWVKDLTVDLLSNVFVNMPMFSKVFGVLQDPTKILDMNVDPNNPAANTNTTNNRSVPEPSTPTVSIPAPKPITVPNSRNSQDVRDRDFDYDNNNSNENRSVKPAAPKLQPVVTREVKPAAPSPVSHKPHVIR